MSVLAVLAWPDWPGVPERAVEVDGVEGVAPGPGAGDVACGLQVGHDRLRGAFGDSGGGADVADPGVGVAGDLHQHMPVPGQQRPRATALTWSTHVLSISLMSKNTCDFYRVSIDG